MGGMAMAPRQPLNDEQRRLLRITATDAPGQRGNNLASVMETWTEDQGPGNAGPPAELAAGLPR